MSRELVRIFWLMLSIIPLPREFYRRWLHSDWQKKISLGQTSYQNADQEAHRYAAIAGCVDYYAPRVRTILDVGCGQGKLAKILMHQRYQGIDVSTDEIAEAQKLGLSTVVFSVCAAEKFESSEKFNVIVFNESLYYMENPLQIIERFLDFLSPEGIFVICMFRTSIERKIGKELNHYILSQRKIRELTSFEVVNSEGLSSVVTCLQRL